MAKLTTLGLVCIVSNASYAWVRKCLDHFYPRLRAALAEQAIEIVSARDLYATSLPYDQLKWKVALFPRIPLGQLFCEDCRPEQSHIPEKCVFFW